MEFRSDMAYNCHPATCGKAPDQVQNLNVAGFHLLPCRGWGAGSNPAGVRVYFRPGGGNTPSGRLKVSKPRPWRNPHPKSELVLKRNPVRRSEPVRGGGRLGFEPRKAIAKGLTGPRVRPLPYRPKRAIGTEQPAIGERAATVEKPITRKRAIGQEKSGSLKRATLLQKPGPEERARARKETGPGKRAIGGEEPTFPERAITHEKPRSSKRAESKEEPAGIKRAIQG